MLNITKFLLIAFGLFVSCNLTLISKKQPKSNKEILTIVTYNMEWLGDGINDTKPRNNDILSKIATILSDLNADVIGVQEVENDAAIKNVVSKMPDYNYYLCKENKKSKLNVGVIYKKNLNLKNIKEYTPLLLPTYNISLREGLVFNVEKNGTEFICMVVHLKSTSRYDSTPALQNLSREIRTNQNQLLSNFVDSINKINPKTKIILLGDFNDNPKRKKYNTMLSLIENPNIFFLTTDQKSCKYPTAYSVDHIVVNNLAKEKYIEGSLFQYNIYNSFNKEVASQISDHCPIAVKFNVAK